MDVNFGRIDGPSKSVDVTFRRFDGMLVDSTGLSVDSTGYSSIRQDFPSIRRDTRRFDGMSQSVDVMSRRFDGTSRRLIEIFEPMT
jgi:hypothetical protein